jgi:hypothetical protein
MKTDRIFVLLLVVMLPMSGCFDDAVGDAEAEEDSSGTTVINNYYNNTTIVESTESGPEYFVVGGMVDNNTTHEGSLQSGFYYYPYNFSTTSGQTVHIHQLTSDVDWIHFMSDCGEGGEWTVSSYGGLGSDEVFAPGSAFDCQHTIRLKSNIPGLGSVFYPPPYYFSAIYSIQNMTVIE